MRTIAFIGVGNMGWPMAANLVKAGYDVTVADVDSERVASFADEVGGRCAIGVRDALTRVLPDIADPCLSDLSRLLCDLENAQSLLLAVVAVMRVEPSHGGLDRLVHLVHA